VRGEGEKKIVN